MLLNWRNLDKALTSSASDFRRECCFACPAPTTAQKTFPLSESPHGENSCLVDITYYCLLIPTLSFIRCIALDKCLCTLCLDLYITAVTVAQSCPTLCKSIDYTVRGTLQVRILEWVAISFSRGSFQSRDRTQVSHIAGGFFTNWAIREVHEVLGKTEQVLLQMQSWTIKKVRKSLAPVGIRNHAGGMKTVDDAVQHWVFMGEAAGLGGRTA